MIASVLGAVDSALPVRLVAATKSKDGAGGADGAEVRDGAARLAGHFPELEDQLCALTWSGLSGLGLAGPGGRDGAGDDGAVRKGARGAADQWL
jgi:phage terminase large subunit-like protein